MLDDLLSIASKTMEGFNPATDSVDDFEKLEDGEYSCILEEVTDRKNDKGTNWVSCKYSIIEGDKANRIIFVNYFFTDKMVERSIKAVNKLAYDFGFELPVEAFTSLKTLAETLNNTIAGKQAIVKQSTGKNEFVNYTVTPVA